MIRLFHEIYANLTGRFWIPCPACSQFFGGHEQSKSDHISTIDGIKLICPRCIDSRVGCDWARENQTIILASRCGCWNDLSH